MVSPSGDQAGSWSTQPAGGIGSWGGGTPRERDELTVRRPRGGLVLLGPRGEGGFSGPVRIDDVDVVAPVAVAPAGEHDPAGQAVPAVGARGGSRRPNRRGGAVGPGREGGDPRRQQARDDDEGQSPP